MVHHQTGQLFLIDLGTAKALKSASGMARTYTILGTPHYMAPEILLGKGYGLMVDIWSIGICMYELMCGLVPFGEECEDPYEVYTMIANRPLSYPAYFLVEANYNSKLLIEQLLSRNPDVRLGGSYSALKAHEWFDCLDWDLLIEGQEEAPFTPGERCGISDVVIKDGVRKGVSIDHEVQKYVKEFKKYITRTVSVDKYWDKEF